MNVWSLDKDITIKLLLLLIEERIGLQHFEILSEDGLSARAVRLNDARIKGLSAYIYTLGHQKEYYGIDLEYPSFVAGSVSNVESLEELTLDEIFDAVTHHFDIT